MKIPKDLELPEGTPEVECHSHSGEVEPYDAPYLVDFMNDVDLFRVLQRRAYWIDVHRILATLEEQGISKRELSRRAGYPTGSVAVALAEATNGFADGGNMRVDYILAGLDALELEPTYPLAESE